MWLEQLLQPHSGGIAAAKQKRRIPTWDANEHFHPHGKRAARAALRVLVAARGDDMVRGVVQPTAHEAPRGTAWHWIGLDADTEG